jgi:hypothetical protein
MERLARESLVVRDSSLAPVAGGESTPVFRFPESLVTLGPAEGFPAVETHRMLRHIEAAIVGERLEYRFIEEEFVADADGQAVRHYEPIDLVTGDSALDVLIAGYQRLEQDRVRERLARIAARVEAEGFETPVAPDAMVEVESTTDSLMLSPTARMRMRVDAVAFLEGRLEAGDFVARSVARQQCYEAPAQVVTQQITERIEVA